jgi:sec-independent protein translocase protein TatA
MGFPSGWELVLVLLVILVLFGAKRLPDSARALGRSMRILKAETKGLRDDDVPAPGSTTVTAEPLPPAQPQQQAYQQQPYQEQPLQQQPGTAQAPQDPQQPRP